MNETLRDAIISEAKRIGADPLDFATVISYETGGTFDAWKAGPTTQWGQHLGLIQMGEPQRQKYGYTKDKSVSELVASAANYLVDRGFKPGMGLMDMYSTINAGGPGRYNASDAGNGGAPGTVADKVNTQMAGHKANAEKLLDGTYQPVSNTNANFVDLQLPETTQAHAAPPSIPDVTPNSPLVPQQAGLYSRDYGDGTFNRQPDSAGVQWIRQKTAEANQTAPNTSYWEGAKAAAESSWFLPNWNAMGDNAPDPQFKMTPELMKNVSEGVDPNYYHIFEDANSTAHAWALRDYALRQQELDKKIADLGWTGTALHMGVEMVDPVSLGVALSTDGALAPLIAAKKYTRLGTIARAAFLSGTANAAATGVLATVDPKLTSEDIAASFGFGAVLGGGLSALIHPGVGKEAADLFNHGDAALTGDSIGAARNPEYNNLFANLTELDAHDLAKADTLRAAADKVQENFITATPIDIARNASPEAQIAMKALVEDGVGSTGDEVLTQSASQRAFRMNHAAMMNYAQTWIPAYNKWAEDIGVPGWRRATRFDDKYIKQFHTLVGDFVESRDPFATFHPSIQKAGTEFRRIMGDFADLANNPGKMNGELRGSISGFENIKPDPYYFAKYANHDAIQSMVQKFSLVEMTKFVRKAIQSAMPEIDKELAHKIAGGYLDRLLRAGLGVQDEFGQVMSRGTRDEIENFLRHELGVDDNETIANFMDLAGINKAAEGSKAAPTSRGMRRTVIDYNYSENGISMRDFFQRDANEVLSRYSREMSGHIALAQVDIVNPRTGEVILQGIKNKADWNALKAWVSKSVGNQGKKAHRIMSAMDYVHEALTGRSHLKNPGSEAVKFARRLQSLNFVRMMQNMGINQAQEAVNTITTLGLKAAIQGIPVLGRIMEGDKSVLRDEVLRDLIAFIGEDGGMFRGSYEHYIDLGATGESPSGKIGDTFDFAMNKAKNVVSKISLMKYVNGATHLYAQRATAQKFANLAFKFRSKIDAGDFKLDDINTLFGSKDARRIRGLGLSDQKAVEVFKNILQHSDGASTGSRLRSLNLEKWDPQARADFIHAVGSWTARQIQRNDVGGMAMWMSHPAAQLLFQFRSFMFGAWTKQTLYGVNHMDLRTVTNWLMQTAAGAATFYITKKMLSLTQDDPEKYMRDNIGDVANGEYGKLAAVGFSRGAFSSMVPMIYNTGALFTGAPPIDYRTSGQASDAIFGNPSIALFNDLRHVSADGLQSMMTGRQQSQQELKTTLRTFAGNWIPLQMLFSSMIKDRPLKRPASLGN